MQKLFRESPEGAPFKNRQRNKKSLAIYSAKKNKKKGYSVELDVGCNVGLKIVILG